MTYYVIALFIACLTFAINIACCIIDFQDFKKLKKRVKALEDKNK